MWQTTFDRDSKVLNIIFFQEEIIEYAIIIYLIIQAG